MNHEPTAASGAPSGDPFPVSSTDLPYLSVAQMVEVDRMMIEDFRIDLVRMMENAGRNLAQLARIRFLGGDPRGRKVTALAGGGGNGGGVLVAARRLANWGASVCVELATPTPELGPVPARQLSILRQMGVAVREPDTSPPDGRSELILDGLIGYSLRGPPHGRARELIEWANGDAAPTLALDAPSGLDLDSGTAHRPTIQAAATMTLALPKAGLRSASARALVGELYLADISVPPGLYARLRLDQADQPLFAHADIIRVF